MTFQSPLQPPRLFWEIPKYLVGRTCNIFSNKFLLALKYARNIHFESSWKIQRTCGFCYLATEIWAVKIRNLHYFTISKNAIHVIFLSRRGKVMLESISYCFKNPLLLDWLSSDYILVIQVRYLMGWWFPGKAQVWLEFLEMPWENQVNIQRMRIILLEK